MDSQHDRASTPIVREWDVEVQEIHVFRVSAPTRAAAGDAAMEAFHDKADAPDRVLVKIKPRGARQQREE